MPAAQPHVVLLQAAHIALHWRDFRRCKPPTQHDFWLTEPCPMLNFLVVGLKPGALASQVLGHKSDALTNYASSTYLLSVFKVTYALIRKEFTIKIHIAHG